MQTVETLRETPLSTAPLNTAPLNTVPLRTGEIGEAAPASPANCAANRADGIRSEISDEIRDEISSKTGRDESSRDDTDPQADLLAELAADPDVRMERVRAIQSALADGTYHVSASEVAAKLVTRLLKK